LSASRKQEGRTPESEAGNETETVRRAEKRRERERLLWCAFSRDAAPDRKSGSHALCRSVLVTQRGTHALSLHRTGPQSATCPCVWTPKKGPRLFLLVEHASRLPVSSIARHEEVSLPFLALCGFASSLSYRGLLLSLAHPRIVRRLRSTYAFSLRNALFAQFRLLRKRTSTLRRLIAT